MAEADLKEQAIKKGLKVGKKVKIHHSERVHGMVLNKTFVGTVTALYPYHFTIRLNNNDRIASYQYKQFLLLKEVVLCGK